MPTPRSTPSASARHWLNAISASIVFVYAAFFCVSFKYAGPRDGDQFLVFHSLQYWNANLFGMAKQWTPLLCSGLSMAGEPQIPFMSLSMVLTYWLGPLAGVKTALAAYMVAGWWGSNLYAGLWLRDKLPRRLAAALYVGNGFFFCRLGYGHFDFIPFLILPFVLWALHQSLTLGGPGLSWPRRTARTAVFVLALGAVLALAIDGSPVAIIHLTIWIGLYGIALACVAKCWMPVLVLLLTVPVAIVLDAGYVMPMLEAQTAFPRLTSDHFTSALSLVWFALLPLQGKILPANGNGHELSVFVGPVVAFCLWRYRRWLTWQTPAVVMRPLIFVALVSIVLGMGSLKALHVPAWLSPFDILRPLPGFRSIGVTGRFWGFLALPLSVLGAAALCRFASETGKGWRLHVTLGLAFLLQIGFQSETLAVHWIGSPRFNAVRGGVHFQAGGEEINYVSIPDERHQGEFLAPNRGVSNCYDMDDFTRTVSASPNGLIMGIMEDGKTASLLTVRAKFMTWSHIQVLPFCRSGDDPACLPASSDRIHMTLGQAYHARWSAPGCDVTGNADHNLTVDCPVSRLRDGPVEVDFHNDVSAKAAMLSILAWTTWPMLLVLSVAIGWRRAIVGRIADR